MALRVMSASRTLKKTLQTGLVDGVSARTMPAGRGSSTIFCSAARGWSRSPRSRSASSRPREVRLVLELLVLGDPEAGLPDRRFGQVAGMGMGGLGRGACAMRSTRGRSKPRKRRRRPLGRLQHQVGGAALALLAGQQLFDDGGHVGLRLMPRGGASAAGRQAFGAGQADAALDPLQHLLAKIGGHQHAGLELQHARIERREDRPDAVLVEMLHHRLGAFRDSRTPAP